MGFDLNFKSIESLESIEKVLKEADLILNNQYELEVSSGLKNYRNTYSRYHSTPKYLADNIVFKSYSGINPIGLNSTTTISSGVARISSGHAGIGVAGIIIGVVGTLFFLSNKDRQLKEAKEKMLQEVICKHDALIRSLKKNEAILKEKLIHSNSINSELINHIKKQEEIIFVLRHEIKKLNIDLGVA